MQDLTVGSIPRHLVQMAAFIAAGMLVQTLYILVDLYFVSGLGKEAIAGVGVGGNAMFVVLALTQVMAVGTVTLISHATGRKDRAEANLVFNQAMLLSTLVGVLLLVVGYVITDRYVASITADAATAAAGKTYLNWYLPGLALQLALTGLGAALRGTGIVKPTMWVQSLTVGLNVILAPILIAGWGTGHPLGVMGAALASSLSILIGVLLLLGYFVRLEHYVAFNASEWPPNFVIWKRLLNVGLPAGGEFALLFIIITVIYASVRQFGADAQAGVGIGLRVAQAIFLPAMAVAFAVSPIAGQNFGAKQPDRVRKTFWSALKIGTVIMLALTALCQWNPRDADSLFLQGSGRGRSRGRVFANNLVELRLQRNYFRLLRPFPGPRQHLASAFEQRHENPDLRAAGALARPSAVGEDRIFLVHLARVDHAAGSDEPVASHRRDATQARVCLAHERFSDRPRYRRSSAQHGICRANGDQLLSFPERHAAVFAACALSDAEELLPAQLRSDRLADVHIPVHGITVATHRRLLYGSHTATLFIGGRHGVHAVGVDAACVRNPLWSAAAGGRR